MEDTIKVIIYLIIIVVAIISSFNQKKEKKNGEFDGDFDITDFDFSKIGKPKEKNTRQQPADFQFGEPSQDTESMHEKHKQSEETPKSYIDYQETYQDNISAAPSSADRGEIINKKLCTHHNDNEKITSTEDDGIYENFEKAAATGNVIDKRIQVSGADVKQNRQEHLLQRHIKGTERFNETPDPKNQISFFKQLLSGDKLKKAFITSIIFERPKF